MLPPPAPEFGAPCPIEPSPATLALLAHRRSASAQTLRAPGPSPEELDALIRLAARVPDHGKLSPWRFVILEGQAKARFVERLRWMAPGQENPEKAEAVLAKIAAPPVTVAVIASPQAAKIPGWEQELSAGAVCMTFLIAAQAMGYGANWITDWYAYEPAALDLLGVRQGEKVAGFVHLGTTAEAPLERARPPLGEMVTQG
jgi:nitroreductase